MEKNGIENKDKKIIDFNQAGELKLVKICMFSNIWIRFSGVKTILS